MSHKCNSCNSRKCKGCVIICLPSPTVGCGEPTDCDAQLGTQFTDISTGTLWIKQGDGCDGWARVITTLQPAV